MLPDDPLDRLRRYPLLDALRERRSRRFGLGMTLPAGPLGYQSRHPGLPLAEGEEALLAFAACGITGPALADLAYAPGQGGTIMAGLVGRTIASGDAIQSVAVFVINAEATYLLKRPRDFALREIAELVALAASDEYQALYRRSRIPVLAGRPAAPHAPPYNLDVNRWSLYDPAGTYFLPVNDLTLLYLNGVLEIFGETTGAFVVDERAGFRAAGLARFARSRGGHLADDPREGRVLTIRDLESLVTEFATIEQGMVIQNLGLMAQAMGLGGFPHWAAHPYGWLHALGFRMDTLPASRYLGLSRPLAWASRLLGRDVPVPLALGLEQGGQVLLAPYRPPYYRSMEAAVRAVVELKFGAAGVFRGGATAGPWRDPSAVAQAAAPPSPAAIDATIAYATYVWERYGRFPAYAPPFRTVLGFQASHLDVEFYDRFYRPEALAATQREHLARWHGGTPPEAPARPDSAR
jgi:hypothetical protein